MRKLFTVKIDEELIERMRDAVYWTPGKTLNGFAEFALRAALDHIEKERGKPYPPRQAALRTGRQITGG